jgi:hypothetical protein
VLQEVNRRIEERVLAVTVAVVARRKRRGGGGGVLTERLVVFVDILFLVYFLVCWCSWLLFGFYSSRGIQTSLTMLFRGHIMPRELPISRGSYFPVLGS